MDKIVKLLDQSVAASRYRYIQAIHKRMVRFQKLTRNLFLTLHGHNVHRQQQQLSKFLMRYRQLASHAYCGAAGPVSKMASQQGKTFCVLRFETSRSVITMQREFRARLRKDAPGRRVFSKPCTKLTLHCNHRSGRLKTEHTESLSLLDASKRSTQKVFPCCDAILETGPAAPQ